MVSLETSGGWLTKADKNQHKTYCYIEESSLLGFEKGPLCCSILVNSGREPPSH